MVVTVMLWVIGAGLFGGSAWFGVCWSCWAAVLRHRRQKGRRADDLFICVRCPLTMMRRVEERGEVVLFCYK